MVTTAVKHNPKWLTPSPLWHGISDNGASSGFIFQPAILRFATDSFMDELMALLNYYPEKLDEWLADPETWRDPQTDPPTSAVLKLSEPVSQLSKKIAKLRSGNGGSKVLSKHNGSGKKNSEKEPFKLYQPAHQRYYLVTASLVCRRPGLPDRVVDPGRQEKASFVIRRVVHPSKTIMTGADLPQCKEYAFVSTESGNAWRNITDDSLLDVDQAIHGEERNPLFSINFDDKENRSRRLWAGLIPAGKREVYLTAQKASDNGNTAGAGSTSPEQAVSDADIRKILFDTQVTAPWKALIEQAAATEEKLKDSSMGHPNFTWDGTEAGADKIKILKTSREQIQTVSWYILLDFAKFLKRHLPGIWDAISGRKTLSPGTAEYSLTETMKTAQISGTLRAGLLSNNAIYSAADIKDNLFDALAAMDIENSNIETQLETIESMYNRDAYNAKSDWPAFLFPLSDPSLADPGDSTIPQITVDETGLNNVQAAHARIDAFSDKIAALLPVRPSYVEKDIVATSDDTLDQREGWFIIRCVYERPNCGPLNPPVVSEASRPFQIAPFFDPDAPARPVRISLPMDISPAGLRKYKKNATFMISDMLCGKIRGIRKLTLGDLVLSVLPWPFHKDLPDIGDAGPCKKGAGVNIGMFCSLSIPIVTLCALVLLIIIAGLFDIFFRWLPYLFTCLPIPGFKGKK